MVWDVKDPQQPAHRSLRINVEFDHANAVKFSPDSKAVIINKSAARAIEIFKLEKKKDWLARIPQSITFQPVHNEENATCIDIANNGKFLMSCGPQTGIVICDLRGNKLGHIPSDLPENTCAKISPCSRFIAVAGRSHEVVVWEVLFGKNGELGDVKKAFHLVGHSSIVDDLAFDVDSSHIATVCRSGIWNLYEMKIDYIRGKPVHPKVSGTYQVQDDESPSRIALTRDSMVVAVSSGSSLNFYSALTGDLDETLDDVAEEPIPRLAFDVTGTLLFAPTDRVIRVFRNVTHYSTTLDYSRNKLNQQQTSAMKERLKQTIADCEKLLESYKKVV